METFPSWKENEAPKYSSDEHDWISSYLLFQHIH